MKMYVEIAAPETGNIKYLVNVKDEIEKDQIIAEIEPETQKSIDKIVTPKQEEEKASGIKRKENKKSTVINNKKNKKRKEIESSSFPLPQTYK